MSHPREPCQPACQPHPRVVSESSTFDVAVIYASLHDHIIISEASELVSQVRLRLIKAPFWSPFWSFGSNRLYSSFDSTPTNTSSDTMQKKAILIAVGGATCSGKTTLAKKLQKALPNNFIIHQDDFAPVSILVYSVFLVSLTS